MAVMWWIPSSFMERPPGVCVEVVAYTTISPRPPGRDPQACAHAERLVALQRAEDDVAARAAQEHPQAVALARPQLGEARQHAAGARAHRQVVAVLAEVVHVEAHVADRDAAAIE